MIARETVKGLAYDCGILQQRLSLPPDRVIEQIDYWMVRAIPSVLYVLCTHG